MPNIVYPIPGSVDASKLSRDDLLLGSLGCSLNDAFQLGAGILVLNPGGKPVFECLSYTGEIMTDADVGQPPQSACNDLRWVIYWMLSGRSYVEAWFNVALMRTTACTLNRFFMVRTYHRDYEIRAQIQWSQISFHL